MIIDDRIAERRAQVRDEGRRKRLRRTIMLLAVLAFIGILVGVERSPLVALEEVEVGGVDRLDGSAVIDAADLTPGTSTVRLRLRAAAERVEELPLVRSASARRIDPLTVHIEVVERQPAVVVTGDSQSRLIDRDGVILVDGELEGLPRIRLGHAPPAPGEHVSADPALGNAHQAWHGLSGPLRAEVERYEAAGPDDLTLVLRSGTEVRFGRADRVDEKVRALGAVLADLGSTSVEVIDVRAPGAPAVVPKG